MTIKLIRNLLAAIPKEGIVVRQMEAASDPHRMALVAKLHEEATEIGNAPTDVEEYGDALEVLLQLAHFNGLTEDQVYHAMMDKRRRLGGFGHGFYMARIT